MYGPEIQTGACCWRHCDGVGSGAGRSFIATMSDDAAQAKLPGMLRCDHIQGYLISKPL